MKTLTPQLFAVAALCNPLVAQSPMHVELTGSITTNSYSTGPFSAGASGDIVTLSFDVLTPGFDIAPGQLTSYDIDPASFDLDINGSTGANFAAQAVCQIQNDFPVSDAFRIPQAQLATGEFFVCEFGAIGTFFGSTDITQLAGTYDVAANMTSFGYAIQGGGGFLEVFPETLRIETPSIGTNFCSANSNSTGAPGTLSAMGSPLAAANDFTLTGSQLPNGQFAYFIASRTQGFVANPGGSFGNLCILGQIARFNRPGEVGAIAGGAFSRMMPLGDFPEPGGSVVVLAGDTWNFQCWHRDFVGGMPTSNFTDALEVIFQ